MFSCMFAVIVTNKTSFFVRFYSGIIAVHARIFPLTVYIRNQCYLFHGSLLSYNTNLTIPRFLGSFMNSPIPPCNIFLASALVYPRPSHQSEQKSSQSEYHAHIAGAMLYLAACFSIFFLMSSVKVIYPDRYFTLFGSMFFSILPARKGQDFKIHALIGQVYMLFSNHLKKFILRDDWHAKFLSLLILS